MKKFIVGWIVLGVLNVYIAGWIDRKMGNPNAAPLTLLFVMGPLGTGACGIMTLVYLGSKSESIFNPIYNLSYED